MKKAARWGIGMGAALGLFAATSVAWADDPKAPPPSKDKSPATAEPAPGKVAVGGDAAFVPLIGDLSNAAGPGIGVLGAAGYRPMPSLEVTARLGYIHHLNKDFGGGTTGISQIPALLGARYHVFPTLSTPYVAAELGPNYVIARSSTGAFGGGSASSSELKVGATIGAGYMYKGFDARAQAFVLDLGHAGDTLALMVNVGYRFDVVP
ncbi:MAG: hypothetical protein JNL38_13740 [Myxococcales bacterium]|nr:hypothetical protein [Myxococcales bacterium]